MTLTNQEAEDTAVAAIVRGLHKFGVSFQTINKALADAVITVSDQRAMDCTQALPMILNGIELVGIVADAGAINKT